MKKGFLLDKLKIELPYKPDVEIRCKWNTHVEQYLMGNCFSDSKDGKMIIYAYSISRKNFEKFRKELGYSIREGKMSRFLTPAHEQVHIAQEYGCFGLVHEKAENFFDREFPSTAIKWWDDNWVADNEILNSNQDRMRHLFENWAHMGAYIYLIENGYPSTKINDFFNRRYGFYGINQLDVSDDFFIENQGLDKWIDKEISSGYLREGNEM
ncbi:MAG: hypothetical protein OQK82_07855 [Candidatus Pacearchaeota archaeon]|nr:hypothetical protein [Candidatus Pacearchaeota archaeon]